MGLFFATFEGQGGASDGGRQTLGGTGWALGGPRHGAIASAGPDNNTPWPRPSFAAQRGTIRRSAFVLGAPAFGLVNLPDRHGRSLALCDDHWGLGHKQDVPGDGALPAFPATKRRGVGEQHRDGDPAANLLVWTPGPRSPSAKMAKAEIERYLRRHVAGAKR